jgi:hypothetical protein
LKSLFQQRSNQSGSIVLLLPEAPMGNLKRIRLLIPAKLDRHYDAVRRALVWPELIYDKHNARV